MKINNKKPQSVAIIIENMVQFLSIKHGIEDLVSNNIEVDLFVPQAGSDETGFREMFNSTSKHLISAGYEVKRTNTKKEYNVLLEPYPVYRFELNFDYRIKYNYSLITAKPNPAFLPQNNIVYDAIFCNSKYSADYLDVYTKTHIIKPPKYRGFNQNSVKKVRARAEKPRLLYLPTYGHVEDDKKSFKAIYELKKYYSIVIKSHHGTRHLKNESDRLLRQKDLADEIYDENTELVDLLKSVDVVLSDNSGAIFDAIYSGVPVAIYASDDNLGQLRGVDTLQHTLVVEGVIPYTNDPDGLLSIIEQAISEGCRRKQAKTRKDLFGGASDKEFIDIVKFYIGKQELSPGSYSQPSALRRFFSDQYKALLKDSDRIVYLNKTISELKDNLSNLEKDIAIKNNEIYIYKTRLLYKSSGKFYNLWDKVKGSREREK